MKSCFKNLKQLDFQSKPSYLSEETFLVDTKSKLSDFGNISFGVPQGSILGLLLFWIYVNYMTQAVKSTIRFLYVDDTCFLYQHKEVD